MKNEDVIYGSNHNTLEQRISKLEEYVKACLEKQYKYLYVENEERKRHHNYLLDAFINKINDLKFQIDDVIKLFVKGDCNLENELLIIDMKFNEKIEKLESVIKLSQKDSVIDSSHTARIVCKDCYCEFSNNHEDGYSYCPCGNRMKSIKTKTYWVTVYKKGKNLTASISNEGEIMNMLYNGYEIIKRISFEVEVDE